MSRLVLVTGFGGPADAEFPAPMLGRQHEVIVSAPGDSLETDADTTLVGIGVGAVAAARHAVENPVRALVLVAGWLEPTERRAEWLDHAHDAVFARHTLVGPESDRTPQPVQAIAIAREIDARDAHLITSPTLVIGATYDVVAPVGQSRLLFGAIPGARWAEVPTGHAVVVERPAEIVALVEGFVRDTATVTLP